MVVFFFFLLPSIVSSLSNQEKLKELEKAGSWPEVCEQHPYAIKATASGFDESKGGTCTLAFPYFTRPEERVEFCKEMFHDNLRGFSGDDFTTTCNYDRIYRCEEGYTLVRSLCFKLHESAETFANAKAKCKGIGGSLAGDFETPDLRYVFYLLNPLKFDLDVRVTWVSQKEQFIMRRGVDLPGQPGQVVAAYQEKANFYCVKNVLRSKIAYQRYCEVLKNSFKLEAHFEMGNCFMLSPSLSIDHYTKGSDSISQKEMDFNHFHQRCKWISNEDYSASPITNTRKKGIVSLMKSSKRNLEIILPGFRVGDDSFYLMNKNIHKGKMETEEIENGAYQFALNEPRTAKERSRHISSKKEDFDSVATSLAMGSEAQFYRMKSMPEYFRGHRVCMSGVSQKEMPIKKCNDKNSPNSHLHSGWKSILRDDGQVMCLKMFMKDLNEANPSQSVDYQCKTYNEAKQICNKAEGFLTPVQSREEQLLIQELIQERLTEIDAFENKHGGVPSGRKVLRGGAIWLGAYKQDPKAVHKETFSWDYDKQTLGYANFAGGEPNNAHGIEQCVQMYTSHPYVWNDISCDMACSNQYASTHNRGAVCARFISS